MFDIAEFVFLSVQNLWRNMYKCTQTTNNKKHVILCESLQHILIMRKKMHVCLTWYVCLEIFHLKKKLHKFSIIQQRKHTQTLNPVRHVIGKPRNWRKQVTLPGCSKYFHWSPVPICFMIQQCKHMQTHTRPKFRETCDWNVLEWQWNYQDLASIVTGPMHLLAPR